MSREKLFSVTIHDCRVDYYRGSGAGGQNRNTRDTAVRITHEPSGAVARSEEQRTQGQNKKIAWKRLTKDRKLMGWIGAEQQRLERKLAGQPSLEQQVEQEMHSIRVEVKENGRWTTLDEGSQPED